MVSETASETSNQVVKESSLFDVPGKTITIYAEAVIQPPSKKEKFLTPGQVPAETYIQHI